MTQKCKIHYLYHSGFSIEIDNQLLIFDYYLDQPLAENKQKSPSNGVISPQYLQEKEETYVFVSHAHQDHFNPLIFEWEQENKDIKYILSSDLPLKDKNNYHYLAPYQELKIDNLNIKSYGTTDQGVSFLVQSKGINIFHAGDLNWWHWKKFSPKQLKQEELDFKKEINNLKEEQVDIALIPVDPRLEEYFYLAGEYLAQKIEPELLIPIHFRDNYQITSDFATKINYLNSEVVKIKKRGQLIYFEK